MRGSGHSRDGANAVPGGLDSIRLISSSEQPANSVFLYPFYRWLCSWVVLWVVNASVLSKGRADRLAEFNQ